MRQRQRGRPREIAPATVGARQLLAALDARGVSITGLATDLELSRNYLQRLIAGDRRPSLELACWLEAAYAIPPRAWLERT